MKKHRRSDPYTAEYRALKRENRALRRQIKSLQSKLDDSEHTQKDIRSLLKFNDKRDYYDNIAERKNTEILTRSENYLSYLYKTVKLSSIYGIFDRLITYFRRIRLIGTVVNVMTFILTLLRTGTMIIVYAVFILLFIPITILFSALVPMISVIFSPKSNKSMRERLSGKEIYIFNPSRNSGFEQSAFFSANAKSLANLESSAVLIVSPYFFKSIPNSKRENINFAVSKDEANIYFVRRYYYFILFKKVLKQHCKELIYIY